MPKRKKELTTFVAFRVAVSDKALIDAVLTEDETFSDFCRIATRTEARRRVMDGAESDTVAVTS